MTAEFNAYESPGNAAPSTARTFPWDAALRSLGGLLIVAGCSAIVISTFRYRLLLDPLVVAALLAWLIGSRLLMIRIHPVLRVLATGLVCGLGIGFMVILCYFFVPPPPGGVRIIKSLPDAVLAAILFGAIYGILGIVPATVGELLLYAGKWLLRKVLGT